MRTVVVKSEGAQSSVEHTSPDRSGKRRLTGRAEDGSTPRSERSVDASEHARTLGRRSDSHRQVVVAP